MGKKVELTALHGMSAAFLFSDSCSHTNREAKGRSTRYALKLVRILLSKLPHPSRKKSKRQRLALFRMRQCADGAQEFC